MLIPYVHARVEERHDLVAVRRNTGEIWSFSEIAVWARQRKILSIVLALMLPSPDVFNVECNPRSSILRQATVLAAMAGSLADELTYRFIHLRGRLPAEQSPGPALQDGDDVKRCTELLVVRSFLVRERTRVRFVGELVNTSLRFRVGAQRDNLLSRVGR